VGKKEKTILLIGNFLSRKGANPAPIETLKTKLEISGFKVIHAQSFPNKYLRMFYRTFHLLINIKKVDIVSIDVYSGDAFLWAAISGKICRIYNKPYICALRGGNLPSFSRTHRQKIIILLSGAKRVISLSHYLIDLFQTSDIQIELIPSAIDLSLFDYHLRNTLGPKLFWLRAFHSIYNPQMAIQTLAIIKKKYPTACLTMAGPDKGEMENCKKLAVEMGVRKQVFFPGKITKSQINKMAKEHDIFINTTNIDNTPVSVIEAMALGMPVVSADVGGIPYLIKHGENGLLVSPGNSDEMAKKILKLISDKELATELSIKGRKTAERFDWKQIFPLWDELFKKLISNNING